MSNPYVGGTIADAIITAINAAWTPTPFTSLVIQEDTEPKTIQQLPFVNLRTLEIRSDPKGPNAGVTSVDDLYRYEIILAFVMPPALGTSAGKVARLKLDYASLLRATLQSGAFFAGVANLPYVTGVDFKNRNPKFDGEETLRILFQCHAQSDYFG